MIQSFADRHTLKLFRGIAAKGIDPAVAERARRLLAVIENMSDPAELAEVPGRDAKRLRGIHEPGDHWQVRVNRQYRIRFVWRQGDAYDVAFGDFH